MKPNENKKISVFQYVVSLIAVAIFASGVTVFIYESSPLTRSSLINSKTSNDLENITSLYELINSQYIEDVSEKDLINGALKGMTDAIGDPHSTFLVEEDAKSFDDSVSGSFEGIGAEMMLENGYPTISKQPIADSPAEKAKLQEGDVIVKVDGEEIKDQELTEIVSKIKGEKGTTVTLEILRGNDTFTVDIVRDTIPVESVTYKIDDDDKEVGYINISSFTETTSDEFNTAVDKLREKGAKKFILDVRDNPGGILQNVEKMTSRFIKDGEPIIGFESKNGDKTEELAEKKFDNGDKITEPTVILVNGNSASASEIMAGALKDNNYEVIGETTYGKGTVQTLFPIKGFGEVKLTISKWLTPKGEWINEKGIEPTVVVDYPEYVKQTGIDQSETYEEGSISPNVKTINMYLKELGYPITDISEKYTSETTNSIKEFQNASGIEATGVTNKETIEKLESAIRDHWKKNDVQYKKALEELN